MPRTADILQQQTRTKFLFYLLVWTCLEGAGCRFAISTTPAGVALVLERFARFTGNLSLGGLASLAGAAPHSRRGTRARVAVLLLYLARCALLFSLDQDDEQHRCAEGESELHGEC